MRECTLEENLVMASMLQLGVEQGLRARLGLPSLFAAEGLNQEHRALVLLAQRVWVDRLGIEAEREACAKVAEKFSDFADHPRDIETARALAVAIRARGAK